MPIQPENKVTPFILPPTPQNKDDLLKWAQDINLVLNQVNRQLVNQFNLHIDQTYAHPKSWDTWRLRRPSYQRDTSDATFHKLIVPATPTNPVNFLVGGKILQTTSSLSLDVTVSGVGGLRSGLSVSPGTVYYLYAVNNNDSPFLIADTSAPDVGLTGYSDWSYLGGFVTIDSSSTLTDFMSTQGIYLDNGYFQNVSTGNASPTAKTVNVPKFSRAVYVEIEMTSYNTVGDRVLAQSRSTIDNQTTLLQRMEGSGTAAGVITARGWLPLLESQTIYIYVNVTVSGTGAARIAGWIEDPTEFK